jgi:DHA3 family tetracycline resistance protein-like MFS transporter
LLFAGRFTWEAKTVYLILSSASIFFYTTIFNIDMIYQLQVAHLNPLQLVLVGTVLEITAFFTQVPTGAFADLHSRRLAVILGVVLTGIGFLIEGSLPHFWSILLAQVFWGAGATFMDGADRAWIADEVGEAQMAPLLLRAAQVGQVCTIAAIPPSVALASARLNLPILLGGGLFLALAALLLVVMPEYGFTPAPREDRSSWHALAETTLSGLRLIRQRPILLTFLGITALMGMFSEGLDRLWTAHLLTNFSFPALGGLNTVAWFGILRASVALLVILAAFLLKRWLDPTRQGAVAWTLFAFTALLMLSLLGFALTTNIVVALLAITCVGVFRRSSEPVFAAWQVQHIDPSVRATVLSIAGQTDALGQIAGGPAVGAIGNVSLRAALVVSGVILSPALLLFARARRQGTIAAPQEEAAPVPLGEASTLN